MQQNYGLYFVISRPAFFFQSLNLCEKPCLKIILKLTFCSSFKSGMSSVNILKHFVCTLGALDRSSIAGLSQFLFQKDIICTFEIKEHWNSTITKRKHVLSYIPIQYAGSRIKVHFFITCSNFSTLMFWQ